MALLWVAVLVGEWLTLLVFPFSALSLVSTVFLPLAALAVTSHWSAARPRPPLVSRFSALPIIRNGAIVIGGGAGVAAAAAVVHYALTASGRESTLLLLVWSAARIGAAIGGLLFAIGLVIAGGRALILRSRGLERPDDAKRAV